MTIPVLVAVVAYETPAVGGESDGAVLAVDGGVGSVGDCLGAATGGGGLHRLQRVTLVPSDRTVKGICVINLVKC